MNSCGFTLIELLIVIAIVCILVAVALPQFSAYRKAAYDAAALSDLRNATTILRAYQHEQKYYPY